MNQRPNDGTECQGVLDGIRTITMAEWVEQGHRMFGLDRLRWRFQCPACGGIQSGLDFIDLGEAPGGAVFTVCVQRLRRGGRCRFTLDTLVRFPNLVILGEDGTKTPAFEFAVPPEHFMDQASCDE